MKKLRFLTLFSVFLEFAFSQVPAGQEQLVPGTQSPSLVTLRMILLWEHCFPTPRNLKWSKDLTIPWSV